MSLTEHIKTHKNAYSLGFLAVVAAVVGLLFIQVDDLENSQLTGAITSSRQVTKKPVIKPIILRKFAPFNVSAPTIAHRGVELATTRPLGSGEYYGGSCLNADGTFDATQTTAYNNMQSTYVADLRPGTDYKCRIKIYPSENGGQASAEMSEEISIKTDPTPGTGTITATQTENGILILSGDKSVVWGGQPSGTTTTDKTLSYDQFLEGNYTMQIEPPLNSTVLSVTDGNGNRLNPPYSQKLASGGSISYHVTYK